MAWSQQLFLHLPVLCPFRYLTLSKDHTELEYYQTAVVKDRQKGNSSDWQQQVELEYGITGRVDAALYQVYEQKEND